MSADLDLVNKQQLIAPLVNLPLLDCPEQDYSHLVQSVVDVDSAVVLD